jgi:hypothetical protein
VIPVCLAFCIGHVVRADDAAQKVEFFEKKIRPLFVKHCQECHGAEAAEAKLRLDSRSGWQKGGERGPAIVAGDPAASLLIRAVSYRDPKLKMPPKDAGGKLTDAQIEDLTTWIRQGAVDPRVGAKIVTDIEAAGQTHWAFQPLAPPAVEANSHPIDFLVERKLREHNLVPTEPADMPTLVRRTTFDLIGLPPTEKQLATARDEFPQLVRELLASPRYGERWGRHWLDVARYSDAKDGVLMYGDARIRPFAYTYRDYVIRAFNDDKPFDQFIREQLAADRMNLPADSTELAALGLLTLGRMFDSNRHDVIDDQIDVVARGFLGLTISCARCHDHKFDPIPTADYYSLYGVFASCIEPLERPRIAPITDAGQPFETEFAAKLKEVLNQQRTHYDATLKTARERTPDYLVQVATTEPDVTETTIFFLSLIPNQLRPQITKRWRQLIARRAFADDPLFGPWHDLMRDPTLTPDKWKARGIDSRIIDGLVAAKPQTPADIARTYGTIIREAWTKNADAADPLAALLIARDGPVWFPERDVVFYLSRQPGDAFRGLVAQLDAICVKHKDAAARAMVVADAEVLCDPVIFLRGDPSARGAPVPRRFLGVLSSQTRSSRTRESSDRSLTTSATTRTDVSSGERPNFADGGGRLDLANAIASRDNPLTARVWVNRVWMHHFGEPLVENPSDFGLRTKRPVQHELLDFLADYFIRNGWRTKPLHELILSSRTYQRASRIPESPQMTKQIEADPTNALMWRANRRRLDFEQMRDTLMSVSGELDETMFGRPPLITDDTNRRRTVYAFVERQNIAAMVQTFDFANADTSTPRRVMTTVPQQALFAMNSPFILCRAKSLATRTTKLAPTNEIPSLYLATFGREPTADELAASLEFRQAGSLEQLAQVLLMSNEMMFLD